jgi:hypothetical protein
MLSISKQVLKTLLLRDHLFHLNSQECFFLRLFFHSYDQSCLTYSLQHFLFHSNYDDLHITDSISILLAFNFFKTCSTAQKTFWTFVSNFINLKRCAFSFNQILGRISELIPLDFEVTLLILQS